MHVMLKKGMIAAVVAVAVALLAGRMFIMNTSGKIVKAIDGGERETAISLIKSATPKELNTPSHSGLVHRLRIITDSGAGTYPIIAAADSGDLEMVQAITAQGADVNVRSLEVEDTPLISCLRSNSQEKFVIAMHLMDHGADVDMENIDGRCALDYALEKDPMILADDQRIRERDNALVMIIENSQVLKGPEKKPELLEKLNIQNETVVLDRLQADGWL